MIHTMRQIIEILNKKYDELLNNNILKQSEITKGIETISSYIESLSKDIENVALINVNEVLNFIEPYVTIDKSTIMDQLRIICIVLKGKREYGFDVCLNEEQLHTLDIFIIYLKNAKEALMSQKKDLLLQTADLNKLEELAFDFECLCEEIESTNNPITKEDFNSINEICNSTYIRSELKLKLLIEVKRHNDNIKQTTNKEQMDINELKQLLTSECNFSDIDLKQVDKLKNLIINKCNINNIKSSIALMKDLKILERFPHDRLLIVLIYGNPDIIREKYNKLSVDNNLKYNFFFETPSVWISNTAKTKNRTRERNRTKTHPKIEGTYVDAYEISYDEILKNKEFLQGIGLDASYLEYGYKSILKTPNYRLKENYEICKSHGLLDSLDKPNAMSILRTSNLENQIDRFIELGLYDYIKRYPSRIYISGENLFATLYKAKRDNKDNYRDIIYSRFREGCLSTDVTNKFLGYNLTNIDEFYRENNKAEININNSEEFEKLILSTREMPIDKEILFDPYIKELEVENALDGQTYKFNNQLISRLKVLRIYSLLVQDERNDRKDALMFALTYNSVIDQESYDFICKTFEYKEASNGLPKKI